MSFPGGWDGKEFVCNVGDLTLGSGRSPGEGMVTHSSILAWRIPWQSRVCLYQLLSHVWLFETSWTVAHQAPLAKGFFRQEYLSRLPFSSLGQLSDLGIKPASPASPILAGEFFATLPPGKPLKYHESSLIWPFEVYVVCIFFCVAEIARLFK